MLWSARIYSGGDDEGTGDPKSRSHDGLPSQSTRDKETIAIEIASQPDFTFEHYLGLLRFRRGVITGITLFSPTYQYPFYHCQPDIHHADHSPPMAPCSVRSSGTNLSVITPQRPKAREK